MAARSRSRHHRVGDRNRAALQCQYLLDFRRIDSPIHSGIRFAVDTILHNGHLQLQTVLPVAQCRVPMAPGHA
jgi:hypothetical protein